MSTRKLAINLAGCSGAVLIVMVIVSMVTGATQEAHEHFAPSNEYALGLIEHAAALRVTFALDVAFLALYTAFFAALAHYLWKRGQPFARLALGFMIGCAVLDIVEDHHIVTMLDAALRGIAPSNGDIELQSVVSSTKFSLSYVALVLFGLAVPRDTKLGLALCLFLTVGTLVSAVIGYSMSPESVHQFDSGRWIGFLAGFALAIAWLWKQPDVAEKA